jgi:protein O-mannosyl-transferase
MERLRRDPGLALVAIALVSALALYAATLGRGLVNYDDDWLVRDNWILQQPSWSSLSTILFDLDSPRRFVLTPEYLPVRDLSVMFDFAIWGTWFPGFHLTSLAIYLASIYVWFVALAAFGVDRRIAGFAILIWALHPLHAESVAWVSERKGLLSVMLAGACALGFARFRSGRAVAWLAMAVACGVFAVWSKATGAFAVASLVGLELALPRHRHSWRRSIVGLGAIGMAAALAFIPVLILAKQASVIGTDVHSPAGRLSTVSGVHGHYLESVAMLSRNSVSYPISVAGPSTAEIILGVLGGVAACAAVYMARRSPRHELRAGVALWAFGWLPVGHLILPLQMVLVADRYMLFPTLGIALIASWAIVQIEHVWLRRSLIIVLLASEAVRTFDAQAAWRDPEALWERAVESNPRDGVAWSMYAEALLDAGASESADEAIAIGLEHSTSPRLQLHRALQLLRHGQREAGREQMRQAAEAGEAVAMTNLALLLYEDHDEPAALAWARKAVATKPYYAHGHRILGKIALMGYPEEARGAFARAHELQPSNLSNRYNLAIALVALRRYQEALPHLHACERDPTLAARAKAELAWIAEHAPQ